MSLAPVVAPFLAYLPFPSLTLPVFSNPLNIVLFTLALYLFYSLLPTASSIPTSLPTSPTSYHWRPEKHPETIVWRSWTPEQLRGYDGTAEGSEGGRILFAIRRKVYDVSSGRQFYGPGASSRIRSRRGADGRRGTILDLCRQGRFEGIGKAEFRDGDDYAAG